MANKKQDNLYKFPCIQVNSKTGSDICFGIYSDTFTGNKNKVSFDEFASKNNIEIDKRFRTSSGEKIPIIKLTTIKAVFLSEPYVSWFKQGKDDKFPVYYRTYEKDAKSETKSETHILCLLVGGTDLDDKEIEIEPTVFEFKAKSNNSKFFLFDSEVTKEKKKDKIGCGFADFKKKIVKDSIIDAFVAKLSFSENPIEVGGSGGSTRIHKIMFDVQTISNTVSTKPFLKDIDLFTQTMNKKQQAREFEIRDREETEKAWPTKAIEEMKSAKTEGDFNRILRDFQDSKKEFARISKQKGFRYSAKENSFVKIEVQTN